MHIWITCPDWWKRIFPGRSVSGAESMEWHISDVNQDNNHASKTGSSLGIIFAVWLGRIWQESMILADR